MYRRMQDKYDETYSDFKLVLDQSLFIRYLGIIFKMSIFNIPNYKRYWEKSEWDGVDFGIHKFMGRNRFNRFQAMFELPAGEG